MIPAQDDQAGFGFVLVVFALAASWSIAIATRAPLVAIVAAVQLVDDRHAVVEGRTFDAVGQEIAGPAVADVPKPVWQLNQRQSGRLVILRADRSVRAGRQRRTFCAAHHEGVQRCRPYRACAYRAALEEAPLTAPAHFATGFIRFDH
jgi:hypothetical protein